MYENSELRVSKNIKFVGEISNTWANDLLGTNVYNTPEYLCWTLQTILQWTNTISVISKLPYLSSF